MSSPCVVPVNFPATIDESAVAAAHSISHRTIFRFPRGRC